MKDTIKFQGHTIYRCPRSFKNDSTQKTMIQTGVCSCATCHYQERNEVANIFCCKSYPHIKKVPAEGTFQQFDSESDKIEYLENNKINDLYVCPVCHHKFYYLEDAIHCCEFDYEHDIDPYDAIPKEER